VTPEYVAFSGHYFQMLAFRRSEFLFLNYGMPTENQSESESLELDFSGERIPDDEVVACCFWEYARESEFIRQVRERSVRHWQDGGKFNKELYADLEMLQSIGYTAEVFLRGFSFPSGERSKKSHPNAPPITGSFPQPWQSLDMAERAYRAHIRSDKEVIPLTPFKRGDWLDAGDIYQFAEARRKEIFAPYEKARRENPEASEVELIRDGKLVPLPEIPNSLYWAGGKEVSIFAIEWAQFTNDEITTHFRHWIKSNRPKTISEPDDRGRKLNDWRVALNRLGIMRALHVSTFANSRFPAKFKSRGEKHCYNARKLAFKKFHELFPFLDKTEEPISWATKGRGER
jgi:hypothetical protein